MACSKRSSSYPSIPFEIVEEILTRSQAESLLRFKAVCKLWYFLITDKKFIYNHLNHSPQRFIRIGKTVQIMDPLTGVCSHSPVPYMFQHMYRPWFPRGWGCPHPHERIIHCDGLMLCLCTSLNSLNGFILGLWSPVLRVMKWIYPSKSTCFLTSDYYGIGYNVKSRHNYKVLRFIDHRFVDIDISARTPSVEIFEFDTGYWRTLDVKLGWNGLRLDIRGLSVKGNTYWIVNNPSIILSFDFSDETFKYVCDCPPLPLSDDACLLGCFDSDRISLVLQDRRSRELQVWITNKLSDQEVLLTRYFSVVHSDLPELKSYSYVTDPVHVIGKNKSIMVWCEERVIEEEGDEERYYYSWLTLYEIDESGVRKQIETDQRRGSFSSYMNTTYNCGYLFVPSLVPLPGSKFSIESC